MHFVYIGAAIIPAIIILVYAYKQDSFPEPPRIVFKTFLFGCATVLGIDLIISELDTFSETNLRGETFHFFNNFIRAAFVEEFFKFCVIVFYCTRKTAFDEPMDGLIYGAAASLGFAAYENINYVLYFYNEPSFDIAITRAFSAVPLHALCGIMMGFLISQSIFEKKHNYLNLILALLIPVGIHGLYNFSYSSSLVSHQVASILLFIFTVRAIMMFSNLKKKQKAGVIFNKKYFTISASNFAQVSGIVLVFYLVLNYIVFKVL